MYNLMVSEQVSFNILKNKNHTKVKERGVMKNSYKDNFNFNLSPSEQEGEMKRQNEEYRKSQERVDMNQENDPSGEVLIPVKTSHLKMFSKNISDILMSVEVIKKAVSCDVDLLNSRNEFDKLTMKINHMGADIAQTIDEFYLK